ncbi:MAG: hypothetical protein NVS9B4_25810 [Candidatus Acidiferrum sp.]
MAEARQSGYELGGSLVLLWSGESAAVSINLIERLESSGIPAKDRPFGGDGTMPTAEPLPIDSKPRFGFEIYVLYADAPAAREILEKVLDETPPDTELPEQPEVIDPATESIAKSAPATLEIWRGTSPQLAEFLVSAFGENNISARTEMAGPQIIVYVAPGAATQSMEILREVLEGAPPS